jgi:hypothetical protein
VCFVSFFPAYAREDRHKAQVGDPLRAVQELQRGRLAAIREGNREAFLATVDPRATQRFKDAQARHYDGLRTVPVERLDLQVRTDLSGDLGRELTGKYGGRTFLPETRLVYRIAGYDDRDAIDTLWLTYVERDGRWYVANDNDLDDLGLLTYRNLWDFGPVVARPSEHFIVLSHPEQASRAEALSGIAEEAAAVIRERWDQPWSGRIPIILPGSVEELEQIIQSTFDLDNFVAFVAYFPIRDVDYVNTAARMFIQDDNLATYQRPFQVETLAHELAHAAGAPLSGPYIPAWVHEGIADWIATGRSTAERRPSGSDGVLPRDYEFTIGSGATIVRAYRESRSAISFLASRKGLGAPAALFRALGEPRAAPGSVDFHVDAALRRAAEMSLDELQRGWNSR